MYKKSRCNAGTLFIYSWSIEFSDAVFLPVGEASVAAVRAAFAVVAVAYAASVAAAAFAHALVVVAVVDVVAADAFQVGASTGVVDAFRVA
jgi:hypothetical protein